MKITQGNICQYDSVTAGILLKISTRSILNAVAVMLLVVAPLQAQSVAKVASVDNESAKLSRSQPAIFEWNNELIRAEVPESGHRFNQLSDEERKSLRQGFKLPLDAIAQADSTSDLVNLSVLRPLPNPSKPFLPVDAKGDSTSNPFETTFANKSTTRHSLGPLGRMFALEGHASEKVSSASSTDPFESTDPFGSDASSESNALAGSTSSESEDSGSDDPFGSLDAGSEEDPFAGF